MTDSLHDSAISLSERPVGGSLSSGPEGAASPVGSVLGAGASDHRGLAELVDPQQGTPLVSGRLSGANIIEVRQPRQDLALGSSPVGVDLAGAGPGSDKHSLSAEEMRAGNEAARTRSELRREGIELPRHLDLCRWGATSTSRWRGLSGALTEVAIRRDGCSDPQRLSYILRVGQR